MNVIIMFLSALATGVLPFQFTYDGKVYKGYEGCIDGVLKVSAVRESHPDFDESEYTVWFENVGDKPSAVLEDVYSLKTTFKGKNPVLRGCYGDIDKFYAQYSKDLTEEDVVFESTSGRATHMYFPYFDLVHGNSGTRIALGWAGTWKAEFKAAGGGVEVSAMADTGMRTMLLPGEKVRTGLVVMMDYEGRGEHVGVNKWRAWYMKYLLPKADADGTPLSPFWTSNFAQDTGLPNCDGSVSETYFTWERTLARLEQENFIPDFRWFDAGWYGKPDGSTSGGEWFSTVGSWTLDAEKWPGDSFRKASEAYHALGMKVLLWFEPERVTHVDDLVKYHGYRREWASNPNLFWITSNIGDPDCLQWTLDRITGIMGQNGIDLYREDNNIDHWERWDMFDKREEDATGLPRKGISQNKIIQGHYALWDGILDFCARNGKCTFLDSCASGGGRNDIEGMKRAIPFLRSDYDRTTVAMRLSQSSGFCKWIPFHGASTKDLEHMTDWMQTAPDLYTTRASLLPVMNYNGPYTHNPDLDFEEFRKSVNLWKSCNRLLTKDFYQLSEWHSPTDTDGWTVFAYNDPESGESILTAFRQETCRDGEYTVTLPFAVKGMTYSILDDDSGRVREMKGEELLKGITLSLGEPRSSLLWRISEKR